MCSGRSAGSRARRVAHAVPHVVTYKETHANAKIDPMKDVWTGTWRDARPFNPEGSKPENALTGTIFTVNAWRNDPLVVPAEYGQMRFWRNTDVAKLKPGTRAVLGSGILGHEWNEDLDNGFRPAGMMHMSETTVNNVPYIQDYGSVYASGTATHSLTLYRASSGALVFSAGTVQWSWGLDPHHDTETGVPPERAQATNIRIGVDLKGPVPAIHQATVNLFADMGAQPATLQPGLVRASVSTDRTAPTSRVEGGPRARRAVSSRSAGAAADAGGGVVAGVEVSIDNGRTWHPAEGTSGGAIGGPPRLASSPEGSFAAARSMTVGIWKAGGERWVWGSCGRVKTIVTTNGVGGERNDPYQNRARGMRAVFARRTARRGYSGAGPYVRGGLAGH